MKLKATIRASLWYMAAMVTAIGALLVSSGIEHSANGWEMLGWAAAALVLLGAGRGQRFPGHAGPWLLCGQGKQERQQGTQSPGGHGEAEKPEKGGLRCGRR